jgi:putative peptidoglycan lipid II flippase
VAGWFNAGILGWILHRRGHFVADQRLKDRLVRIVGATVVMGIVVALLDWWLASAFAGLLLARLAALCIVIAAGLASFGVAALALRAAHLSEIKALLKR